MFKVTQINYDIRPIPKPDAKLNQKEYATKEMAEQAVLEFANKLCDALNDNHDLNGYHFVVKRPEEFNDAERKTCARHFLSILWYNYGPRDIHVEYELKTAIGWEIV